MNTRPELNQSLDGTSRRRTSREIEVRLKMVSAFANRMRKRRGWHLPDVRNALQWPVSLLILYTVSPFTLFLRYAQSMGMAALGRAKVQARHDSKQELRGYRP